jgi:hypothetical protein
MPSKKQIYEIVAMQLSGGVPQRASKFSDPRPVYAIMDTVRDKLVAEFLIPQIYNERFVDSAYISTITPVTVQEDTTASVMYSVFPVKLLELPRDMQVYQIYPTQSVGDSFVRIAAHTAWMYKDNPAIGLQNNIGYYTDKTKAYYQNINPQVTEVSMRLVVAGQSIDEDDFYIGNELMQALIESTMKLMQPMASIPQDMSNNNA